MTVAWGASNVASILAATEERVCVVVMAPSLRPGLPDRCAAAQSSQRNLRLGLHRESDDESIQEEVERDQDGREYRIRLHDC